MKKVSVIMGVYNCKRKDILEKSINSIIHQTYQDWEFLICDDGSVDDTCSKLQAFSRQDNRIRILHYAENRGLNYALNYCLAEAEGIYIARQDDDDLSAPDRLEKQVKVLDTMPMYAIVGTAAEVYHDGGVWGNFNVPEHPLKKSFLWNSPFIHPTVMIRKEALEAVHGYRVAKETRRCEDYDLFMRMYAGGYQGYNIQEKLYLYRSENGNTKHRPMKYRIDEVVVRWKGYRALNMLGTGLPFIVKPVLVGLIPAKLLKVIKMKQYGLRIVNKVD